jgi:hypothetical protein
MDHLMELINKIHTGCFQLCREALGVHLPVAGNVGVFCQSEEDFGEFTKLRDKLVHPSSNPNQKYFELKEPITVSEIDDIPSTTYTYLYIRKPNLASPEAGDIDFVTPRDEYAILKQKLLNGESVPNAFVYGRPGWDMIELRNPKINALAYIGTKEMVEKVRIKF